MANIAAAQSGDFSATSTWTGGVVPGSGDVAYSNTFTVTISDTRTVQAISNASATGITVGGTFSLLNGCNLTCTNANGIVQGAVATSCVTTPSLGVGTTATVAASFQHTAASPTTHTVAFSTGGTLNVIGNATGPNNNASGGLAAINYAGSGVLNFTGNIKAGSVSQAYGIVCSGSNAINIVGNVSGSDAVNNAYGLYLVTGASAITVTGNCIGGNAAPAVYMSFSGTLTVNGACQSGSGSFAVNSASSVAISRFSGPFLLALSGNFSPIYVYSWRWAPTQIPTYMEVVASNGSTKRNLYTADNMPSGGYPTAANVRASTVYGPSSEFTGTLAVPAVGSVALGVAVDNTTGTAVLTAANVRTAMGLASANLDAQLAALPTAAQIASAVWSAASRTLTTAIDNSATIAAAVWSAATRTLTSSSAPTAADNAAAVWGYGSGRTITGGTVDTLTNAPTVPSAAAIASQVRTELTPELARVANCSTVDTTYETVQDALSPN